MTLKHLMWMYAGLFAIMLDAWIIYTLGATYGPLFYVLQIPLLIWGMLTLLHGRA